MRERKGNSERRDSLKKGERSSMLLHVCTCTCVDVHVEAVQGCIHAYIYTGSRAGLEKHMHTFIYRHTVGFCQKLTLTLYTLVHFIAQYVHYVNAHAFPYMACNAATAR